MINRFVPLFKGLSSDGMFHVRKVRQYFDFTRFDKLYLHCAYLYVLKYEALWMFIYRYAAYTKQREIVWLL